jgi:outer membrane protein TolC
VSIVSKIAAPRLVLKLRVLRAQWLSLFTAGVVLLSLQSAGFAQTTTSVTLDQAIDLALAHNHALKATRTMILQNQAQEITANLRPNPNFGFDSQFIPIFSPSDFSLDNLNLTQQFDVGLSYLFERGHKRQSRLRAARDQTAVTRAQVSDAERTLAFNVGQEFVSVLLAASSLQFAQEVPVCVGLQRPEFGRNFLSVMLLKVGQSAAILRVSETSSKIDVSSSMSEFGDELYVS